MNGYGYILDVLSENPVVFVLILVVFLLIIQIVLLTIRINRLTRGGDGKSLEGTIRKVTERVGILEAHAKTAETALENLDGRMQGAVRGVATERFDPFQNAGGQQSFATAFLNEQGDGVVVSGIHVRDGVRVYAKTVKAFASERELSEEEQSAIKKAKESLS